MRRREWIPSLDGLRAISVTLVVAGHWITWHYHSPVAQAHANLGVRVFFVISGYLITTLLLKEYAKTSSISLREFYVFGQLISRNDCSSAALSLRMTANSINLPWSKPRNWTK
jgi:fucose 4-O-acetylase-like acetyltransferase